MKASELRIGNIVESFGTNGAPDRWVLIIVTADHIKTCQSNPELFRPVKLSPEWLQRAGFKKTTHFGLCGPSFDTAEPTDDESDVYHGGTFYYTNEKLNIEFTNEHGEYANINFQDIKYVHQLQNLYFALTGTELEFKEYAEH